MDLGVNRKRMRLPIIVTLDVHVSPTIEILTFKARKWLVFLPSLILMPPLTAWGNPLEYLGETYPAKTKMVW